MRVNFCMLRWKKVSFLMMLSSCLSWQHSFVDAAVTDPVTCTNIPSSLERLSCFDAYFSTPIHETKQSSANRSGDGYLPEIIRIAQRAETKRQGNNAGLLIQRSIDHEASGQDRMILSAPAIGSLPPRPLLVISCINDITRFQIGFSEPLSDNYLRTTLALDGSTSGGDFTWQVIETGKVVDAGRGIPSINILKRVAKHQRLTIHADNSRLNGLTFDISDLTHVLPGFRKACHW